MSYLVQITPDSVFWMHFDTNCDWSTVIPHIFNIREITVNILEKMLRKKINIPGTWIFLHLKKSSTVYIYSPKKMFLNHDNSELS